MNLRSGNIYRSDGQVPPSVSSWKSSKESVTNRHTPLDLILEESECLSKFNVSVDMYQEKPESSETPYAICLVHVKTNIWGAQIYKDPTKRWVVKIDTCHGF